MELIWPILAVPAGLLLLVWSSGRFVSGAALAARLSGISPLLIGILIIGFGTSTPELLVSAMAASAGSPELALGNAYGSNIANISLILGLAALVMPIRVHSQVLRRELPILCAVSALSFLILLNGRISRLDAAMLLGLFAAAMGWMVRQSLREPADALLQEAGQSLPETMGVSMGKAAGDIVVGLLVLMGSSRMLVWGAVEIARYFKVSDLVIGLTIVAVGTSLPELASTLAAVRKGEDDLAVGNIVGSNLFNTLAVVGLAGIIHPLDVDPAVLTRDFPIMAALTLFLFLFGSSRKEGEGRINRVEGGGLFATFVGYTVYLVWSTLQALGT